MDDSHDRLIWQDGRVIPFGQFTISPNDRGLLLGLGLFETTRTARGRPWRWDRHLARMTRSAADLGFEIAAASLPSDSDVAAFVAAIGAGDVVVRLNHTFGSAIETGTTWMIARPLPAPRATMTLRVSPFRVEPSDPIASVKAISYAARQLAHNEAVAHGADDALLLNPQGDVLEAAHGNLFFRIDGRWRTPPLTGGVLPGVCRERVLELRDVDETPVDAESLRRATEIFFTNSARGVVPVVKLDDRTLTIGDDVLAIQREIASEFE